ncbi:3-deoxy-7-phosphoheptulonate synthase/chorismate mutase [Scopulibacillus daqui]|uniref:3-deoxy-7-phosphoheptulonate synthase/chorismate mutase n=1 Tax=Scopulibacillus daqui TaxID=1469162 RepID=A0ABS2PY31_9BACL|nr:bifunctional 3-deoxy-7-phosphoheptulonate synthase/chorismate mutase [Scopulibacillus daqui]MBM7644858.1 3-deoxy-7-phosphoheptulonate synthase/chorismate mutase [Scopulibacillus daqui]
MNVVEMDNLKKKLDEIDIKLLDTLNERAKLVKEMIHHKKLQGLPAFDPVREREMLNHIAKNNQGPFAAETLQHIFKEIYKAGLELGENDNRKALLVSRRKKAEDTIVQVNKDSIGDGKQRLIAGPCSVESYEQTAKVAERLKEHGLTLLRGGAFKPRTSPYDFQGLGLDGLKILKRIADEYQLSVISEIVSPNDIETAEAYVDVIQIGARNMQNFELLKEAGQSRKPILLKRGLAATIEEFMNAAEYIISSGNENIILCERGIRTYERATRNTLDITAVPILKQETHLPVFVDVTHSTGRRDLLQPAAKAAMAVGADGLMAEVHPDPAVALSDQAQQMDLEQFDHFVSILKNFGLHTNKNE